MVIRRAARFGSKIGFDRPFLADVAEAVIEHMGDHYTELVEKQAAIRQAITLEEERFRRTLDRGVTELEDALDRLAGKAIRPARHGRLLFEKPPSSAHRGHSATSARNAASPSTSGIPCGEERHPGQRRRTGDGQFREGRSLPQVLVLIAQNLMRPVGSPTSLRAPETTAVCSLCWSMATASTVRSTATGSWSLLPAHLVLRGIGGQVSDSWRDRRTKRRIEIEDMRRPWAD
jgi:hypothetical protein